MTPERPIALLWSDALREATTDPLEAARLAQSYALLDLYGLLGWREVEVVAPDMALGAADALTAFHEPSYVHAVEALDSGQATLWSAKALGFGAESTPSFIGMAAQARAYVASAQTAVRLLTTGRHTLSYALAANQPQAHRNQSANGDIFNDVLLALLAARRAGHRVAFINLEAEHPQAIQAQFYEDNGLLFLSLHEAPFFGYPGSGEVSEIGVGAGQGYTVNLPLAPGSEGRSLRRFWQELAAPLLDRFEPEIVVLLMGTTAHYHEALAHLVFEIADYVAFVAAVAAAAPRLAILGGDGSEPLLTAQLAVSTIATLVGRTPPARAPLPHRFVSQFGHNERVENRKRPTLPPSYEQFAAIHLEQMLHTLQKGLHAQWGVPITAEAVADPLSFVTAPPPTLEPPARAITPQEMSRLEEARPQRRARKSDHGPRHPPSSKKGEGSGSGGRSGKRRRRGRSRRGRG